ncbi:MAG: hypothetical protein GC185_04430 [Alphaproteobacteria bacterium]|nr:hypothetical protein [Alphaproteobacteria bacterium]
MKKRIEQDKPFSSRLPAVLCLLAALLLAGGAARAQAVKNFRNAEIRKFERDGGKVDYLGTAYGLDGWVMFDKNKQFRSVVYSTPEGAMLRGSLFDPEGKSVTKMQLEAYHAREKGSQAALPNADNPDSGLPKSEYFYAALEKANWTRVGKADAPYLYMIVNVNCDHCQELWKSLAPDEEKGNLQLRILPFGKSEANLNGGAALLSVDDPGKAWEAYMKGDKDALGVKKIETGALEKMKANNAFMAKWKPRGSPFVIYRRLADGKLTVIVGKPENPLLVMSELMKPNE